MFDEKTDMKIACKECLQQFTWTAGEQEFYAERGRVQPRRSKECRGASREARRHSDEGRPPAA